LILLSLIWYILWKGAQKISSWLNSWVFNYPVWTHTVLLSVHKNPSAPRETWTNDKFQNFIHPTRPRRRRCSDCFGVCSCVAAAVGANLCDPAHEIGTPLYSCFCKFLRSLGHSLVPSFLYILPERKFRIRTSFSSTKII